MDHHFLTMGRPGASAVPLEQRADRAVRALAALVREDLHACVGQGVDRASQATVSSWMAPSSAGEAHIGRP